MFNTMLTYPRCGFESHNSVRTRFQGDFVGGMRIEQKDKSMKRLLVSAAVIGLFVAAEPAFAQAGPTASASANANANIVGVIGITKANDMTFGNLVSPAQATDVVMAANGALTPTSIAVPGGASGTPARFNVTGSSSAAYTYRAALTNSTISLSDGNSHSMNLDLVIDGLTTLRTGLQGDGTDSVVVRGTLHVGAAQVAGSYTGAMTVTVQYD
jgi:spore coat protein U-like protein